MRLAILLTALLWAAHARAAALVVEVTVAPLHSLVSAVMAGAGRPGLIVSGAVSPHDYALRPSEAKRLGAATVLFRLGGPVEATLDKPIETLAAKATVVSMIELPDLVLLRRRGADWQGQRDVRAAGPADADGHFWQDPYNATIMIDAIAGALSRLDPDRTTIYQGNAQHLMGDVETLDRLIRQRLEPVKNRPFAVYHDAYHYFESRYGLNGLGALTSDPELPPGAQRIAAIQQKMKASKAKCLFIEPETQPALADSIESATDARAAALDPLEFTLKPGPQYYITQMQKMADTMADCLK